MQNYTIIFIYKYMCMSMNKRTAYTFTYVGPHKQIRIYNQSAVLMIMSDIYQMLSVFI